MLKTSFLNKTLKNPLIAASGTFGFGENYHSFFDPNILGGIALKGITLEPRLGNSGTRIAETASGMLNAIGLQNPGIDEFERQILPALEDSIKNTMLIANINGKTIEEYEQIAERANHWHKIDAIELNISCPNVKEGGMAFGTQPKTAAEITSRVKKILHTKPLVVKLSPNVVDIGTVAQAVEDAGADALSLINTILGMRIDIHSRRPILGNIFGGLSGPAVKPIALRMVWQVRQKSMLPILAGGGISNAEDGLEFLMAGANVLSIGTAFFSNPLVAQEIIEQLEKYCIKHKINNINSISGSAHTTIQGEIHE